MLRLSARLPNKIKCLPSSVFFRASSSSKSDDTDELSTLYREFLREEPEFPASDPNIAMSEFESKIYPENLLKWQDMSKEEMVRLLREVDTLMKLPKSKRKEVVLKKYLATDPRVILTHSDPYARLHENPHIYRDLWLVESSDQQLSEHDEKRRKLQEDRVAELLEIAAGTQSNRVSDWDSLRQRYRDEYMRNLKQRLENLPKAKCEALLQQIQTEDPALEHQAELFSRQAIQKLFSSFSPEAIEKISNQAIVDKYEGSQRQAPSLVDTAAKKAAEAEASQQELNEVKQALKDLRKEYLPDSTSDLFSSPQSIDNVLRPLPQTLSRDIEMEAIQIQKAIFSKLKATAGEERRARIEIDNMKKRPNIQRYDLLMQLVLDKESELQNLEQAIEEADGDRDEEVKKMKAIERDLSFIRQEARRLQRDATIQHFVNVRQQIDDAVLQQARLRSDLSALKSWTANASILLQQLEEQETDARVLVELDDLLESIRRDTVDDWSERNSIGPIEPITVDERTERAKAISQIIAPHTLSLDAPLNPKEQRDLHDIRKLRAKMAYNARVVLQSTLEKARKDEKSLDPKAKEAIDLLAKQVPDFRYEEPVPKKLSFIDYSRADWYSKEMREYADRMRLKLEFLYGDDPENSKAQMIGSLLDMNLDAEEQDDLTLLASSQTGESENIQDRDDGELVSSSFDNPEANQQEQEETDNDMDDEKDDEGASEVTSSKRDLLLNYMNAREEPQTKESYLKEELLEEILEDAARVDELDPEAWPHEQEDNRVDNRWYRMSDHDPIWSEDWSLRDPKYYHTDQAKQDIEYNFDPDEGALEDEDLMEWNSGVQLMAEDVQRAVYLLHWSDPVTYTPRALSAKFRAPLDHIRSVLKRKAFRHWLHFHPEAYSTWHRGLRKSPDGKIHDWVGFWSVYRSQRKAEIMASNMRSPYERSMLIKELSKESDASVSSIVEKWKDHYRIRELKFEMFGESMLLPSEDQAQAELESALEKDASPLTQHANLVREAVRELLLGKVLSDKSSVPLTPELEKIISSVSSSLVDINMTSSSSAPLDKAANTLSSATQNKVPASALMPDLIRLQKVDQLLASGTSLEDLVTQGLVTAEEYQRAYTSMDYALYKKRLGQGSLTSYWFNAPFTEEQLNEYSAALPKDRLGVAFEQIHSPFRLGSYDHASSRAAVLDAKLENMLREPVFDLSNKEEALQWVEIWSYKYEAAWEKKFLSNWKKFRMIKMQWTEAEADREIERLKVGIEKSKLLRRTLIQRHKDKEEKWKLLFTDVEKYLQESGDESLPTSDERTLSAKFLPRLLAAMDEAQNADPAFFSTFKLFEKQIKLAAKNKYFLEDSEEEQLYLKFMSGKDGAMNEQLAELKKYLEDGNIQNQWKNCLETLPVYVEKFAPYFPDLSQEEVEKSITAVMKCVVNDSEQAFAAFYDFEADMGVEKGDDVEDPDLDDMENDVYEEVAADDPEPPIADVDYISLQEKENNRKAGLKEISEDDVEEESADDESSLDEADKSSEDSDDLEDVLAAEVSSKKTTYNKRQRDAPEEEEDSDIEHISDVARLAEERDRLLPTEETSHFREIQREVDMARATQVAAGVEPSVPSAVTLTEGVKGGRKLEADAIKYGIGELVAPEDPDIVNMDARRETMFGGQLEQDSAFVSEDQMETEMFKPPNVAGLGPERASEAFREHILDLMEYGYDIFPDEEVLKSQPEPLQKFVRALIDEIKEDFTRAHGTTNPLEKMPSRRSRRVAVKLGKPEIPPQLQRVPDDLVAERHLQTEFDWRDDPFDMPYTLEMSIEITKDEVAKNLIYHERDLSDLYDERTLRFWTEQAPEHTWLPVTEIEVTDEELSEDDIHDSAAEKNERLDLMKNDEMTLSGEREFDPPSEGEGDVHEIDDSDDSDAMREADLPWDMQSPLLKQPSNYKLLSYFNPQPCGDDIFSRRPVLLAEDWEVSKLKRKEQAWQDRFKRKNERLEEEEKERYRLNGPLGSTPPPKPAPELVDLRVFPRTRFHTVLTDISELPFARYSVVVRDRDGTLRSPTSKEFTRVRYRERNEHDDFHYIRFSVPDQPKARSSQQ